MVVLKDKEKVEFDPRFGKIEIIKRITNIENSELNTT